MSQLIASGGQSIGQEYNQLKISVFFIIILWLSARWLKCAHCIVGARALPAINVHASWDAGIHSFSQHLLGTTPSAVHGSTDTVPARVDFTLRVRGQNPARVPVGMKGIALPS